MRLAPYDELVSWYRLLDPTLDHREENGVVHGCLQASGSWPQHHSSRAWFGRREQRLLHEGTIPLHAVRSFGADARFEPRAQSGVRAPDRRHAHLAARSNVRRGPGSRRGGLLAGRRLVDRLRSTTESAAGIERAKSRPRGVSALPSSRRLHIRAKGPNGGAAEIEPTSYSVFLEAEFIEYLAVRLSEIPPQIPPL